MASPLPPCPHLPQPTAGIPIPPLPTPLRLDGNQGRPPAAGLLAGLADEGELLRAYPAGDALERALAARHGVAPEQVLLGAGADELLDRTCRAFLAPGRALVLPVPTFEMLERYGRLAGADVVKVPWTDGPWPGAAVAAAAAGRPAVIACVSPNNPTGLVATAADLEALAALPGEALVVLDHAYAEFAGQDLTAVALRLPQAIVLRTFSKAWGLAGVRLGYALGPAPVLAALRACGSPFTVGRLARAVATAVLQRGAAAMADYVRTAVAERGELTALLARLGLRPLPSQGNFVFARTRHGDWLRQALLPLGIAVRAFAFGGLGDDGVRITVPGDGAAFAQLAAALRAAMAPPALLFDLDGVLADVTGRRSLVDPADLQALAADHRLGCVTGCPRRLAESVLQRHGLRPYLGALVCSEDAAPKPDPAPVRLCLQQLGVDTGWFLGDNPGDVQAARGAGVVPLAVAPHGIGAAAHEAALRAAGAAVLVAGVTGLRALRAALADRA